MSDAFKAAGNELMQAGKFVEAAEQYGKGIEVDPSNHVLYSNRSAALLQAGEAERALEDAQKCVEIKSDWWKGYSRLGAAQHALRRYNEAITTYERGLTVEPGNASLLEAKASAEAAEASASAGAGGMPGLNMGALLSNPKVREYFKDPEFLAKFQRMQTDPSTMTEALNDPRMMEVLTAMMGGGDMGGGMGGFDVGGSEDMPGAAGSGGGYEAAREEPSTKKKEEERPETPEEELSEEERERRRASKRAAARKAEGDAAYRKRDFDAALEAWSDAESMDPDDSNIVYSLNKAAVQFMRDELDECEETCKKALEKEGVDFKLKAKAWARIGNVAAKRNDYDRAIECYDNSLLESHNDKVWEQLRAVKRAKKNAEESAYMDPDKALEAKQRGNEFFKSGKFVEAIKEYSEAIKRDPSSAVFYSNRAAALLKVGDAASALDDAKKSIELDPKYAKAYAKKGAAEMLRKEFHKAIETYQTGLTIDPENPELLEGYGQVTSKVNSMMYSNEVDEEQQARALADPEIQTIMNDPMVRSALDDLSSARSQDDIQRVLQDRIAGPKISKLIAAGVIRMGGAARAGGSKDDD